MKKKKIKVATFLIFTFAFFALPFALPSHALEVPPAPKTFVYDAAGYLLPQMKSRLEQELQNFERTTTNQVIFATFPSLEGDSMEDFSIRLAEKWMPGDAAQDNGVLLLVFEEEKTVRIEVGYGLEAVLTDARSQVILQEIFIPRARENDYDSAIYGALHAIMDATSGEYKAPAHYRTEGENAAFQALMRSTIPYLAGFLFFCFILLVIDIVRYARFKNEHAYFRSRYSFWEWFFRFALLLFVLNLLFKIVFYALMFSRGGSIGGRDGSSGFSGGGGSFGGGGASGRW